MIIVASYWIGQQAYSWMPPQGTAETLTPLRAGKYRLRDSQFSGTFFALMEADVYAESLAAYDQWLAQAATHKLAIAYNRAFSEYTQQTAKAKRTRWPTVVPTQVLAN